LPEPTVSEAVALPPGGDCDTHAWYQPVHFYGYDFGIFVRERSVVELAQEMSDAARTAGSELDSSPVTTAQLLREAFLGLYFHAMFHHRVECLGIRMHVVERRARYDRYMSNAYAKAQGSDDLLEEALANAFAYRMLARRAFSSDVPADVRRVATNYLKDSWNTSPPGYRMATRYLTPTGWAQGVGELHSRVQDGSNESTRPATWRHLGPDLTDGFLDPARDVFVVASTAAPAILSRGAGTVSTCSPQEMIRILEGAGYTVVRSGKGSDVKLRCAGRPSAFVPGPAVLTPGTAARLLALVDATPADLPRLLRQP
jgi:hypothetical protein